MSGVGRDIGGGAGGAGGAGNDVAQELAEVKVEIKELKKVIEEQQQKLEDEGNDARWLLIATALAADKQRLVELQKEKNRLAERREREQQREQQQQQQAQAGLSAAQAEELIRKTADETIARCERKRRFEEEDVWTNASSKQTRNFPDRDKNFRPRVLRRFYGDDHENEELVCAVSHRRFPAKLVEVAPIFPFYTAGQGLRKFGLLPEDVESDRNGIPMHRALHDLFDQKKIAFVYHPLKQELICKVLATGAEDKSIELEGHCGDQPPVTVGQCDGLTLTVGHGDDDEPLWPFRRLLSVHASIAFSKSDLPDDAKQEFRDFLNVSDGALRPDNIDIYWP